MKQLSQLPPRYTVSVTKSTEASAATVVHRNGHVWATVDLTRSIVDGRTGLVEVKVESAGDQCGIEEKVVPRHYRLHFDRLTGLEIHSKV